MFQGLDNRWLVKMNSKAAASYLVLAGINVHNRHVFIRYYDDGLAEEYSEYLEYEELMSALHLASELQKYE